MVINTISDLPSRSPVAATARGHSSLATLEIEFIDFFVQFSRALGQPKSVAALVRNLPAAERTRVQARMNMLHGWQKKTRRLALAVRKALETAVGKKRGTICKRKVGQTADRTVFSAFQRTRFFRGPPV